MPLPSGPRRRPAPVSLDVSRTLEQLLGSAAPDFVHVHEPFAPSASSAALRHSLSLNVASFHEPAERVLSTQVARPLVEIFFGRIDDRTASNRATGELLSGYFPGPYELIRPGADRAEPLLPRTRAGPDRLLSPTRSAGRCASSCARCAGCPRTSTGRRSCGARRRPT